MGLRIRWVVALAAAMLPCLDGAAQTRTPPLRNGIKVAPKLSAVTPAADAAALAALLVGSGVTVSNAALTGHPLAIGTFAGGQAIIGIDSGVVLSTGEVVDVLGPNQFDSTSTDFGRPGDPALDALVAPYMTQDAMILEFDVIPVGATISLRYVFGSEEYPEYVGSAFNDVVAIFVNGVNCANYNGRPVSVNTINAGINAGLFIDNDLGMRNTEMDGLTVPLECVAAVTPNKPNHVRIAIADTSDGIYDAAVFVAAHGMTSPAAGPVTGSSLTKVIEYHHAEFDHYFVTAIADEITKLDNGTFKGWARTGQAFNVFLSGTPDTAVVCRFFTVKFPPKSTHFYTPFAPECASLKAGTTWDYEGTVFNVILPAADGSCPPGTQALYRLYNSGMGAAPNHRYTTDLATFSMMTGLGWTPEGSGVGVIACVPT